MPGWPLRGCRCHIETPEARGKCCPDGLLSARGQSCCWSLVAWLGWGPLSRSGWPWRFSSPSSSSPQHGQCLSVCPSVVSAFSRTPQGQERVAASPGSSGRLVFRRPGPAAGVCCPEWPSSRRSRTVAYGWGASAAGACCGRP